MDNRSVAQLEGLDIIGDRAEVDISVEIDRRAVVAGFRRAKGEDVHQRLNNLVVVVRVVVPHVVPVDQVDRAVLAGAEHQVRDRRPG